MTPWCVVAVDGPAGTGKSTVARGVARRLGARYLDTGAMYRAATWAVLAAGVPLDDPGAVADVVRRAAIDITTDTEDDRVGVDGTDVTAQIRAERVNTVVSIVAAVPAVRAHLVDTQRAIIGTTDPIVVEGRDIGTVVAPDAAVKIFLTAAPDVRAARRSKQAGAADVGTVAAAISRRDGIDARTNPLRPAPGAETVDTSALSADEVVAAVLAIVHASAEATARPAEAEGD